MEAKERELITKVVDSYPYITSQAPSSWVVFNNDLTKWQAGVHDICHAAMTRHSSGVYDQCVTGVPMSQALDLAYITFLMDGPFKHFRDRISLEMLGDKFFLRCNRLDTWPANVLYNFCIATRIPIERQNFLVPWGKLCAAGVNETLAFLFASRVFYSGDYCSKKVIPIPEDIDPWEWKLDKLDVPGGHFWFDSTSSWRSIIAGEMAVKAFSQSYKKNPLGSRPTNIIWGDADKVEANDLVGKTVKQLSDHFGLTKVGEKSTIEKMVEQYVAWAAEDDHIIVNDFDELDDDDDIFGDEDF